MPIPTEPIGSIPRPASLLQAIADFESGKINRAVLDGAYAEAIRDTIERFVVKDNLSMQPSHSAIRIDRYAGSRPLSLSDAYPLIGAQLGKSWRVALIRVRGKLFQHRRGPDGNSSLDHG